MLFSINERGIFNPLSERAVKRSALFGILSEVLFYLMLAAIIAAAVAFANSRSQDKSIFGYRYYDVLTDSMELTYSVGDLIFVRVCSADEIQRTRGM